jgi:tRNA-dihydrouridine synthase 2
MVAGVCREAGVACLMNGDVEGRDEALRLVEEYGADGAMIATAAERNPSCFRTDADGGLVPWQEAAAEYLREAIGTQNKFGNTKFVVSQMVPGKHLQRNPVYQAKGYVDMCEALRLPHLRDAAEGLDAELELGAFSQKPVKKGKPSQVAMAAGGDMAAARASEKEKRKSMNAKGAVQPVEEDQAAEASVAYG